jgi:hypothetical protein
MGKDKGRLTAERTQSEDRHVALMAVAHSLSAFERVSFLGKAVRQWPRFDGAMVADVLDATVDHDMFLDKTEPFFERFSDQIPPYEGNYAAIFAVHAVIIMGLELSPARVAYFLQRAGVIEAPRYPDVQVGLWAHDGDQGDIRDANHLLLMARAEQGMRAQGVPEHVITEFRSAVRATSLPGYSRNVADIAAWVTLTDRYTPLPRKVYDPADDLAALVSYMHGKFIASPGYGPAGVALDNLRSHLDVSTPETIRVSLAALLGKEA